MYGTRRYILSAISVDGKVRLWQLGESGDGGDGVPPSPHLVSFKRNYLKVGRYLPRYVSLGPVGTVRYGNPTPIVV